MRGNDSKDGLGQVKSGQGVQVVRREAVAESPSPVGVNEIVSKLTGNFNLRKSRLYRSESAHWARPPREVPSHYLLKLYYRPFPRLPLRGYTHQGVRGSMVNA